MDILADFFALHLVVKSAKPNVFCAISAKISQGSRHYIDEEHFYFV